MIYTVRGPIEKTQMGKTLAHEHINWISDEYFAGRMYFDKHYDESYNQEIFNKVIPILNALHNLGCGTVVEASPPAGGQDLKLLYDLSCKSNMNIIPSTGMNITKYAYHIFNENFEVQLANKWIQDFEEGLDVIDGVCIKPGYIKLLIDRGPVSDVDKAMLKAAAMACKKTGMPIHCHILEAKQIHEVISVPEAMEVPPHKFVWAHAGFEGHLDTILEVVKKGYWVGFDMIKVGTYEKYLKLIEHAVANNYINQVLLSEDNDLYEEGNKIDGIERYCDLFNTFIPLCIKNGIPKYLMESIIIDNPARYYDF